MRINYPPQVPVHLFFGVLRLERGMPDGHDFPRLLLCILKWQNENPEAPFRWEEGKVSQE